MYVDQGSAAYYAWIIEWPLRLDIKISGNTAIPLTYLSKEVSRLIMDSVMQKFLHVTNNFIRVESYPPLVSITVKYYSDFAIIVLSGRFKILSLKGTWKNVYLWIKIYFMLFGSTFRTLNCIGAYCRCWDSSDKGV